MNELKWSEAKADWGELFYATDPQADYDFSDIVLFHKDDKYALFFDSGCSCNSSFEDNPGGDVYDKGQLLKLMKVWNKGVYSQERTEQVMKEWILENIK